MGVVFKTFDVIEIDGIAAGNIVDVISNHRPRRAEVLEAFGVFCDEFRAQKGSELAEQVKSLTTEKKTLTESLAEANKTIAELQQRITALEAIRAFNPRWTTPDFFINRFTAKEAKAFYSSDDLMIEGGRQLLEAYEQAGYHVDLDDTEVQGLTGYMVQLGMLTLERREEVLRDCTAQEAWYPS